MQVGKQSVNGVIWIKPHVNSSGNLVKGHWRTLPKVIKVKGHFRELGFVRPHKRRRPTPVSGTSLMLAGQPDLVEHTLINILRDIEPLMGY